MKQILVTLRSNINTSLYTPDYTRKNLTQISRTHSVSDVIDFVVENYGNILEWGKDYLKPQLAGGRKNVPSIAQLEAEEAVLD